MTWFKGNTHTHTSRSDGDTSLEKVVRWYAARNYDWLAITDHWKALSREDAERLSADCGIVVIPGVELSAKTAHVVALGVPDDCPPQTIKSETTLDKLQQSVDWVRAHGGIPILAHPNWMYPWNIAELEKIRDCNLFEVHNAGPDCNTFAAGGKPGTDDLWDAALNKGIRIYGVGCDDSHHFKRKSFHKGHTTAHGGEGWTYIEAVRCDEASVLNALTQGRCVASSGAAPVRADFIDGVYRVEITDPYEWFQFTTTFIGPDGILAEAHGRQVEFRPAKNVAWMRARVFCSSGRYLWTQPAFHS